MITLYKNTETRASADHPPNTPTVGPTGPTDLGDATVNCQW